MLQPRSSARNTRQIRRSSATASRRASSSSPSSTSSDRHSQAARPSSSERSPLRNASLNVRPIAIASPTDFIWVVSVRSASGNFSKFQRGTLTTT